MSPTPRVASLRSKASLPFHHLGLFTGFEAVSSQTPLLVTARHLGFCVDAQNILTLKAGGGVGGTRTLGQLLIQAEPTVGSQ